MNVRDTVWGHLTVEAGTTKPGSVSDLVDGRYSVRLTAYSEPMMVYVDGTLDELAKLVADLAGVVRELTARELAATATA